MFLSKLNVVYFGKPKVLQKIKKPLERRFFTFEV
jgi:hypothetical protein